MIDPVLLEHRAAAAAQRLEMLTRRHRDVLRLMVEGRRNKEIAFALGIDEKTVKMHRAELLRRLGARSTAEAVGLAVEARFAGLHLVPAALPAVPRHEVRPVPLPQLSVN